MALNMPFWPSQTIAKGICLKLLKTDSNYYYFLFERNVNLILCGYKLQAATKTHPPFATYFPSITITFPDS